MLIKCDVPESMSGIVSSAGPIDCQPGGMRGARGEWKYSIGGVLILVLAMFLLVLLADEAMGGHMVLSLLHSLGHA